MLAILQLRKKYDQEKDKTTKIETNIERLEEVKLLLLVQEGKFKREEEQLKNVPFFVIPEFLVHGRTLKKDRFRG